MLDYGKLVTQLAAQVRSQFGEDRSKLRHVAAISFIGKNSQFYLPQFAKLEDVRMVSQISRIEYNKRQDRMLETVATFTSTVEIDNGQLVFGKQLLSFRNLMRMPTFHPREGEFGPHESPELNEALELHRVRMAVRDAVASKAHVPSTVCMPQLMVGFDKLPSEGLRTIPLPPDVTGAGVWLIPASSVLPEYGTPQGLYLDMRAWRGREFPNNLGVLFPTIINPLLRLVREMFPNVADTDLHKLPENQQNMLMQAVQQQYPDLPEDMLLRAYKNYTAPVRVSPGFGISYEDAYEQCRRQLGVYGPGVEDVDIRYALSHPEQPLMIAGAPRIFGFRFRAVDADTFGNSQFRTQFSWAADAISEEISRSKPGGESFEYTHSEWSQIISKAMEAGREQWPAKQQSRQAPNTAHQPNQRKFKQQPQRNHVPKQHVQTPAAAATAPPQQGQPNRENMSRQQKRAAYKAKLKAAAKKRRPNENAVRGASAQDSPPAATNEAVLTAPGASVSTVPAGSCDSSAGLSPV